ncbi:MAG: hypothetical protein ACYC6Y_14920, partial [Thermoguttaceae bacterium]
AALLGLVAVYGLNRWFARRVLFCLLVGLVSHLWLGLYLHEQYLEVVALHAEEQRAWKAQDEEFSVVPDYHVSQLSPIAPPQSFEKPVDTEPPRESQPLEVEKKAAEHEVVAEQPAPVPQTLPDTPPSPFQIQRADSSVPLQADRAAGLKLSRQSQPERPEPSDPIPQPETPETAPAPAATLSAAEALSAALREDVLTRLQPARQALPPVALSQPGASLPENRRDAVVPSPAELPSTSQSIARSAGPEPSAPEVLPQAAPTPGPATAVPSPATIAAGDTRAARRIDSPAAVAVGPAGSAAPPAALAPSAETDARIGRPMPSPGQRPALESGGVGNPLSRSNRALPAAPADLPAADQMASTGTGAGVRPDTSLDASVEGLTRRTTGTTTDLAIGRVSSDPPAGTMWGDQGAPAAIRRAAVEPSLVSGSSSGGGRQPLARSTYAPAAAMASPGDLVPEMPASGTAPGGTGAPGAALGSAGSQAGSADSLSGTGAGPSRSTAPERMELSGASGLQAGSSPGATAGGVGDGSPSPVAALEPAGEPDGRMPARPSSPTAGSQPQHMATGPAVPIRQPDGPGGLSDLPAPDLGIPNRHARPESVVVHNSPGRFLLDRAAGRPPMDASLMKPPAAAFKQRLPGARNEMAKKYGATEGSDRAVEQGLYFLARCQLPDGRWAIDRLPSGVSDRPAEAGVGEMNADTAATGLALLAFLGKGYTHVNDKYRSQVGAGLRWLVSNQQENGSLFNDQSDQTVYAQFYAHGIATIALGEAYGMTWDEELLEPLQRAIAFTLRAQHPQRGGWRYRAQEETDTSVSGWHLMALKSAQMARLEIPTESLVRVSGWLDLSQGQDGSRYRNNPYAIDNPSQR